MADEAQLLRPATTASPWLPVLLLAVATFVVVCTEMLPVGLLPLIADSLEVSEPRAGLLTSAYAAVVVTCSIPLAALMTRWPRRTTLVVALVVFTLANTVFALTSSYWVALAARICSALAHAMFFTLSFVIAVSLVPPERVGRTVAKMSAGVTLAFALGVPLGTALAGTLGWRWVFAGVATLFAVLALTTRRYLPVVPATMDSTGTDGTAANGSGGAGAAARNVLRGLLNGALLRTVAVLVLAMFGHYTLYTYLSPILARAGLSPTWVALMLFVMGTGSALGLVVAARHADTRPRSAAVVSLLLAAVMTWAFVSQADGSRLLLALLVLTWGTSIGTLPTLVQTLAYRSSRQAPDAVPAAVNTSFNIAISTGAAVGSYLLASHTPTQLSQVAAIGIALAAVLACLPRWLPTTVRTTSTPGS